MAEPFPSVDAALEALKGQDYVADRDIGLAVYLATSMRKPLLVEGEPGCGKTEIAKAIAAALRTELIRLQCYEGLDANAALYEWDYPKQLLTIRIHERERNAQALEREVFSERYLLERPLLRALRAEGATPPVLLIDELDRADEEFEGLLLEVLSEFQISVPELGTIRAKTIPIVVITSNRTRELSDALKRRCLYLYIGYPKPEKELEILRKKVPGLSGPLGEQICGFMARVREGDSWAKRPGVSESLDWARGLVTLGESRLTPGLVKATAGFVFKEAEDLRALGGGGAESLLGPDRGG